MATGFYEYVYYYYFIRRAITYLPKHTGNFPEHERKRGEVYIAKVTEKQRGLSIGVPFTRRYVTSAYLNKPNRPGGHIPGRTCDFL